MRVDMEKELNKIEREVQKEKGALVFDVKDMVPKVVKFCEALWNNVLSVPERVCSGLLKVCCLK